MLCWAAYFRSSDTVWNKQHVNSLSTYKAVLNEESRVRWGSSWYQPLWKTIVEHRKYINVVKFLCEMIFKMDERGGTNLRLQEGWAHPCSLWSGPSAAGLHAVPPQYPHLPLEQDSLKIFVVLLRKYSKIALLRSSMASSRWHRTLRSMRSSKWA